MSYSNGIIYPRVRLQANNGDIELAVGHTSGNLATCISNGSINMWAKYKPVRLNSINTLDQWDSSAQEWRNDSSWWKGDDGKCGAYISVFTDLGSTSTPGTFLYMLKNGQLGWTYNRPRGGAYNEPFRQTDFALYNAGAINPMGNIGSTDIYLQNNGRFSVSFDLTPSTYGLSLSDFEINRTSLSRFYMGLLMWNGSRYEVVTSESRLGTSSIDITVENASSLAGVWQIVPFFSSVEFPIGATYTTGTFLSANITTPISITVHAAGTLYEVISDAYWSASNKITISTRVFNHDSGQRTISNVYAEIRYTTSGSQDPSEGTTISGTQINYGSVTVSGNSSYTLSERVVTVTKSNNRIYWVMSNATGVANSYNQVDEDEPMAD